MRFHRKLMRFLRILFMRSRQKVMTSATLIYSPHPHLNEIPPQKRGVTGAPYTTYDQSCSQRWIKIDRDQPKFIKKCKLYSKRQLQGLIKQREKTVITIFRLAWQYRSSSGLF